MTSNPAALPRNRASQATINYPAPTPAPVTQLVEFFSLHDEELRFPGVDADSLKECVAEADQHREAVEKAAEQLAQACEKLAQIEESLLEKARRGHAYASIFAADSPELLEELNDMKLGAPQRAPRKRRPVAASKSRSTRPSLSSEEKQLASDGLVTRPDSTERLEGEAPVAAE